MSTKPKHELVSLADQLKSEIHGDAEALGPRVLGSNQPDAHHVNQDAYLAYIRQGWMGKFGDPVKFRMDLLQQIGAESFIAIGKAAWEPAIRAYAEMPQPPAPTPLPAPGPSPMPMPQVAPTPQPQPMPGPVPRPWPQGPPTAG